MLHVSDGVMVVHILFAVLSFLTDTSEFVFVQAKGMFYNTAKSVPHETVHRSAYKER